jgi:S-adenosylmethionine:tRNA ribosyltransferase-isomerase
MPIPLVFSDDFDYILPNEKIAKYPLTNRDESQLLILKDESFTTSSYKNISQYLPENSLLVFNNSKVIPARLLYVKSTLGVIEIFCLNPMSKTPNEALQDKLSSRWICLIGGLKKWEKDTPLIWTINEMAILEAYFIQADQLGYEIEFRWKNSNITFGELLERLGQMPIPPYLLRKSEAADSERYQTTYATQAGSVAAPTAGLHFTTAIFDDLKMKKINCAYATLHVGAGTFKPVTATHAHEHNMHAEWIEVSRFFLEYLHDHNNITAVGTTSIRIIESIYWFGLLALKQNEILHNQNYTLPQFTPYQENDFLSKNEVLESLVQKMDLFGLESLCFKTQLMILPSYVFKIATRLVTNFHQPKSTLLMLISAATKGKWQPLYNYALENNYRFLSYGDGCLIDL